MQLLMPPPAVRFVILFICKKFFDFCKKYLQSARTRRIMSPKSTEYFVFRVG